MAGKPTRPESGRAHKALADHSCPLPPGLESTADGEANRPETGGSFGMGVQFAYSPPFIRGEIALRLPRCGITPARTPPLAA